jgi:uncharacterized protein
VRSPISHNRVIETLILQSTPFCNIDCTYCYLPDRASKQRMTESTLEKSFERIFSSPFVGDHLSILWHAGEPLVVGVDYYRRAFDLLERHRPRNVNVTCHFQTNGILLNQEWVDLFRANNIKVGLSLDGPADLHDRSRKSRNGKGTFEEAMRGLRVLQDNSFPFHVITVLTKDSLHSASKLFEFYFANGITQLAFNTEEIEGVHTSSSLQAGDADRKIREFYREFFDLATRSQPQLHVREFEGAFHAIVNPSSRDYGNPMTEPLRFVSIGVNGEISTFSPELLGYSNGRHHTFVFGNVHLNNLADVLENPDFLSAQEEIDLGVQACSNSCEYFGICLGGVPGNKLFEKDSFAVTETLFCRLSKKAVIDVVLERIEGELGISS